MSISQVEKRRRNQLSPEFVGEESKKNQNDGNNGRSSKHKLGRFSK